MHEVPASLAYHLDEEYRVVAIDGPWDRFAAENAATELVASRVLGESLWRFVEGEEVRYLLRLLMEHARERNTSVNVPFRCDAPGVRRFMNMTVHARPGGLLRVESTTLREEPRAYVSLLERSPRLLYGTLSICSWCKRIRLFDQEWVEVEEALERLDLFASADLPQLSHGICIPCAHRTFEVIYINGASRGV